MEALVPRKTPSVAMYCAIAVLPHISST